MMAYGRCLLAISWLGVFGCDGSAMQSDAAGTDAAVDALLVGCRNGLVEPGELCFDTPVNVAAKDSPDKLIAADLNGDGRIDLISSHETDGVCVFLATALEVFQPCQLVHSGPSKHLAAARLDGDAHVDLAVGRAVDYGMTMLWGLGDGEFGAGATVGQNQGTFAYLFLAAADFDGDGDMDLSVNGDAGNIQTYLSEGDRTFESVESRLTVGQGGGAVVAHFTVDDHADLAWTINTGAGLQLALGDGRGGFSPGFSCSSCAGSSVVTDDFDGDGDPDVATASYQGNAVTVRLGSRASGSFLTSDTFSVGTNPISIASGDLNADGNVDLVTADLAADGISVLLGQGNGLFDAARPLSLLPGGRGPMAVVVVDINSDGLDDIATINRITSNLSVFLSAP